MKLKLKRMRELLGYAFELLKSEGFFAMARRALGFFRRRLFGKRARYLPKKKVLQAQRAALSIHRTICATSSDVFPWDTRLPLI